MKEKTLYNTDALNEIELELSSAKGSGVAILISKKEALVALVDKETDRKLGLRVKPKQMVKFIHLAYLSLVEEGVIVE